MSVAKRIFRGWASPVLAGAFLIAAAGMLSPAYAAPHWGEVMSMEQPDGSQVDVKVFGDEFYLRVESLDGYPLTRDPKSNAICYAALNADASAWVSTGAIYAGAGGAVPSLSGPGLQPGSDLNPAAREAIRNAARQSAGVDGIAPEPLMAPRALGKSAAVDSVKKVLGVIILVEFPDVRATVTRRGIDSLANLPGFALNGNNGSVRDYWLSVSHGMLDYSLVVTEYHLAKNNKSYYDRSGGYAGGQEMIKEVLAALEARGFDFSTLTTSASKTVRGINIMYAGSSGKVWGQGIWPHRGNITTTTYDGVKVSGYMMTSVGTTPTIGTFCHESGHLIMGWPDLYDYDSDSRGAGSFCLMSGQVSKNPQPPNPWFRAGAGWEPMLDLKKATSGLVLMPSNGRANYKYGNPATTKEAYVIENVAKKGRWTNLPDDGLLIWHVDSAGNNSWQDMTTARHYRVAVVQADGKSDLEKNVNGGGANDLFHLGNNVAFSSSTVPAAKWWSGTDAGLDIFNISAVKDTMTFQLRGLPVTGVAGSGPARAGLAVSGRLARFTLPGAGNVRVTAASADGRVRVLAEGAMSAGAHALQLSGMPTGACALSVTGDGFRASARVTVLDP